VIEKAQEYRDGTEVSNELHYIFCDEFDGWSKETFQKANSASVRALRDVLLSKGVFIPKNNKPVVNHLVKLLETEALEPWPNDVKQPIALLAHQIKQGTQRMEENVEKATVVNDELMRVAEIQEERIKAITPRRLFHNPLAARARRPLTPTPLNLFPRGIRAQTPPLPPF